MKEKIKTIILIIIFICILVSIKLLLDYKSKNMLEDHNTVNEVTNINNIENEIINQNQILEEENVMGNSVLEVTEENFEKEVLSESKKVLIDFYADWCGPCQVLSPIVEEVAKSNTNVKVVKLNVDNAQSIAVEYGVMSIPTLVVIEDGNEIKRSVGLISQSEVEELIK